MFIMLSIGLYTSRVVLQVLGVVDFGLYNVVSSAISFLSFLTGSLSIASSRFITYYLSKSDVNDLKSLFSNVLSVYIVLSLLILILGETIGLWMVYERMVIPDNRMIAALWVYHISVFSAILNVLCTPYISVIVAHENMSAFAYLSILDVVMKLGIAFVIQYSTVDKLILYAVLILFVQIVDRIVYSYYCSKKFKETVTKPKFDKKIFFQIFSFAGWVSIGALAYSCYTIGLNILLNIFFGPVVNAARGVAFRIQEIVNNFCINVQAALTPQITKSFSSGDNLRLKMLIYKGSKYTFFLMLIISLPIIFNITILLEWWLGTVPEWTSIFSILMLIDIIIRTLAYPVVQAVQATGDIKKFQLVEGGIQLFILPFSYVLLRYFSVPPYVPFLVIILFEPFIQYFRVKIALPILGMSKLEYLKEVIYPVLLVVVLSPVVPYILKKYLFQISDITSFSIIVIITFLSTFFIILFCGCGKQERKTLFLFCKRHIK